MNPSFTQACPIRASGIRAFVSFIAVLASAAATPLPVPFASEYQAENWGFSEGFPENSCSGIVAADDGYMWIATFRGLVRFNGQDFKPWAPAAMPGLRSTGITSMYRDRGGRVWLSTVEGLVTNERDSWRRWTPAEGWDNPIDHVRSYAEGTNGELVLTRFSGRVLKLENGRFRELPMPPGQGGTLAALDADGALYFARGGHAGWLTDGAWQPIAGAPKVNGQALGVTQLHSGYALLICRDEMLKLRGGKMVERIRLSAPVSTFWQATEEADGTLWLAAIDSGVYRIKRDGDVRHFRRTDGLPSGGGTRVVHIARDGSIWIGSGVGGLTRFRSTRFRYLAETEGLPDREVLTLTQMADGRMLFSPYGSGLHAFDGVGAVRPVASGANVPLYCRAILCSREGVLWVGAYGAGLFRIESGTSRRVAAEFFPPEEKESVHSLFEDSRGRIWVGGERTIVVHDRGTFVRVPLPAANVSRRPTLFAERRDGSILIGQHEDIYVVGANGLLPQLLVRLAPDARISSLLVDDRDRVWIGTAGQGLAAFDGRKLLMLPPGRGLPGSNIAALVQDDAGQLWFGSGRNVVRASPDDLWAAMSDPNSEPRMLRFDRDDGVRHLDFTYGTQPNVHKDAQGRLWFAMIRGVAMIDPRSIKLNEEPPPVVIESISYVPDEARQPVTFPIVRGQPSPVLPAGSRLIRIDYAALDFSAPGKQRFRLALDGEWQDMHGDASVSFLELPPGRHTLVVQASGSDGAWNRAGGKLEFEIAPFYWQTVWFRVGLGLAAVGLVGLGVWLVSDRRTRVAREILERERKLAEAQARLASVLENTSDFVAFSDGAGNLAYLNPAGRALVGIGEGADVRSTRVSSIFPPWAQTLHASEALPAAQDKGTWSGETALLRSTDEIPVSMVLIAHRGTDGTPEFVSMIARDISAAKRHALVQDALRRLATDLTAALRPVSLGRAVADACRTLFSHDAFFVVLLNQDEGESVSVAYAEAAAIAGAAPEFVSSARVNVGLLPRLLEGRALLVSGEPESCDFGKRPVLSAMYAPVCSDRGIVAVLSVHSYIDGRYRQGDLDLLQTVADHCAAAIVRLYADEMLRKS